MKKFTHVLGGLALVISCSVQADAEKKPEGWLFDVDTDTERFQLLHNYLGGFSAAMWQVGERYRVVHDALERENYDLALYHWDKIRDAIRGGYMKRPGRQASADALFLNSVWQQSRNAIASEDSAKAWEGFSQARAACMACHQAERVPFMNNQALFDLQPPK